MQTPIVVTQTQTNGITLHIHRVEFALLPNSKSEYVKKGTIHPLMYNNSILNFEFM